MRASIFPPWIHTSTCSWTASDLAEVPSYNFRILERTIMDESQTKNPSRPSPHSSTLNTRNLATTLSHQKPTCFRDNTNKLALSPHPSISNSPVNRLGNYALAGIKELLPTDSKQPYGGHNHVQAIFVDRNLLCNVYPESCLRPGGSRRANKPVRSHGRPN